MVSNIIEKYVRDLKGLRKEVDSYKKIFKFPEEKGWDELLPVYHETVIFFFAILYKYFIFEGIPIFSGGQGLDAWIEHKGKKIHVEFEVLSSEFIRTHSDDEKKECDLVVCWKDNSRKTHEFWKHIDVFELSYFWE